LEDAGRVDVYLGSDSGLATVPAWTVFGDAEVATWGTAIAGGDLDGDGFADLLVGA
jgi:hypothetical protein